MKRRYLVVFAAILAVGLGLAGCDLFEGDAGSVREAYAPLIITGKDSEGLPVKIVFSTTRPLRAATMIPDNGDSYEIRYNVIERVVSRGTIKVSKSVITFRPVEGNSFTGTYTGGSNLNLPSVLTLAGGIIIMDFKTTGDGASVDSSTAKDIADQLGKDAAVEGNDVVINNDIEVTRNIVIPAGVKLVFKTANDKFTIKSSNVSVTANGGIEVPDGRDVTVTGEGSLVIGGKSTVSGKLDIDKATLDIPASVTIESGGVLSLKDAALKGSGSLIVKNGARLIVPALLGSNLTGLTGVMDVEAGGEMILVNAASPHPLIGTFGTEIDDFPVGADFVMNAGADPGSKIKVKVTSGKPELELTGKAVALGLLDIKEIAKEKRADIWLTYKFTVAKDSVLQVGSTDITYSSLLVSGKNTIIPGFEAGELINNGIVLVFEKSGIFVCFDGKFNPNKVYKQKGSDSASPETIIPRQGSANIADIEVTGSIWDGRDWPSWSEK